MDNCKICNEETNIYFEIDRFDYFICDKCARSIFLSMATAYGKQQTIFDIGAKKQRRAVTKHPEIAAEVLDYLYVDLVKSRKTRYTIDKIPQAYLDLISARVNEGHTSEELKAVTWKKYKEWGTDSYMKKYLQAKTLYGKQNFAMYIAELSDEMPDWKVISTADQKAIIKELNSYGVRGVADEHTDKLAKELMATGYDRKTFLNLYLTEKI